MIKKNKWGQKSGGWSPFAQSRPAPAKRTICNICDGAGEYEAFDRVQRAWFTYTCTSC